MRAQLAPDSRVLLLLIPDPGVVDELAAALTEGLIVCAGAREEVYAARARHRERENVMFVEGSADEIPWRDGFFTALFGPDSSPSPEGRRVLAPGGVYLKWSE